MLPASCSGTLLYQHQHAPADNSVRGRCPAAATFCHPHRSLSLRKLKSSNTKLAFGTLLNGTTSPDWRFKLLAQYLLRAVSIQLLHVRTMVCFKRISKGSFFVVSCAKLVGTWACQGSSVAAVAMLHVTQ